MANEDHVAIVKQEAEAIRRWREEHPGQRLMLDTADLSGTDLSGADLRGAFLYKADLRGTTLSGADLQRADLKGTDLSETFLTSAILYKADFRDARLAGAILAEVEGAHQACGLETTRLTLVPHKSTGTDSTPGQPSPETTPTLSPPDQPHDDFNFGTCIRPWPERLVDWECLRRVGQLPLFGASYTALSLILILFYGLALYNDQVKWVHTQAEQIMAQPDQLLYRLASLILARFQPLPIPQQSLLLLVSTLLLVIGSTLYTSSCPPRIKEFSRDQWCYQLGRSLLHYWPLAWKYRYIRLVCAACYTLGGLGVGYVLLMKAGRVLLFILKNSPYPWLWR